VLGLRRKHPFVYPIHPDRPPPRVAVFLPCFLSRPPVRVFRKAWAAEKWTEEGWPDNGWSEERRAANGCGDRGASERELSQTRGNQDRCSEDRCGEDRWNKELRKFAPEAIAATFGQFKRLVHAEVPRLRNAVIVLHRTVPPGSDAQLCDDAPLIDPARSYDPARKDPARSCHPPRLSDGVRIERDARLSDSVRIKRDGRLSDGVWIKRDAWLTDPDRDWLWSAFRVPIFEQIIGESGELLATECEAHNGMHVQSAKLRCEQRDLDTTPCACGRDSPRLFPVREASPPEIPPRSATAHA
jgi:hypothetical protein